MDATWKELSDRLEQALHLGTPPVAIAFSASPPPGVAAFAAPMSAAAEDGRRGRVPASCSFWVHGTTSAFTTAPEDHGNCSVGSVTHGLATLDEVAHHTDVAELLASGWVTPEAIGGLPAVAAPPAAISYCPLGETPATVEPTVVLLRVNGRQMMVLSDALPGMTIEGKPQCHIIALAKERRVPAASVGCALSRARTGMTPEEMTVALPAADLPDLLGAIEATAAIDNAVARYAARDARRFS